jgi:abortive infection bacteriophage resistance protein
MRIWRVLSYKEVGLQYTDKALTLDEQVESLLLKGLVADESNLRECLGNVSYHRLSGYWHTFRNLDADGDWHFNPGTHFSTAWERYVFDRQLRLLTLDAIERVEVAIRNDLILSLATNQGPFGYLDPDNLPNIQTLNNSGTVVFEHSDFLSKARSLCKRELNNSNPAVVALPLSSSPQP